MLYTVKQNKIIDASIEIIAEKSIQGFTIKNLAQKLGVTEGAIYRHFIGKIEILLGILKKFQEECKPTLKIACSSELSAFAGIDNIFNHHFNYFAAKPAVSAVIFSESIFQNDNLLSIEVYKLLKMHEDCLTCIIKRGQENGEIKINNINIEQIIIIIIGSIRYAVKKWRISNYKYDIKSEGKILLENLKELLKA
jgi:AcrR family transcriptional regulator